MREHLIETEKRGEHVLYRLDGNPQMDALIQPLERVGELEDGDPEWRAAVQAIEATS